MREMILNLLYLQAVFSTLASSEEAVRVLASFGIAYSLVIFWAGATSEFRYASLVLVRNHADRRKMILVLAVIASSAILLALVIGKRFSLQVILALYRFAIPV